MCLRYQYVRYKGRYDIGGNTVLGVYEEVHESVSAKGSYATCC